MLNNTTLATLRNICDAASSDFHRANSAHNDASDAVAMLRELAYAHPSHEALDVLEAAERLERRAWATYVAANDRSERVHRVLLQATGRMPASDAETRFALVQEEALAA